MTSATNMEQNCAYTGNPVPQERAAPTVRLFRAQVTLPGESQNFWSPAWSTLQSLRYVINNKSKWAVSGQPWV